MPKTPFDVVHEIMVGAVIATNKYKAGNLVDYATDTKDQKKAVQTSDLPEIVTYLANIRGNLTANSSNSHVTGVWNWIISTGSFNSNSMNLLLFDLMRLHLNWEQVLRPVQWRDKIFVTGTNIVNIQLGESDSANNRNISGWVAVAAFEVQMSIFQADLLLGAE